MGKGTASRLGMHVGLLHMMTNHMCVVLLYLAHWILSHDTALASSTYTTELLVGICCCYQHVHFVQHRPVHQDQIHSCSSIWHQRHVPQRRLQHVQAAYGIWTNLRVQQRQSYTKKVINNLTSVISNQCH